MLSVNSIATKWQNAELNVALNKENSSGKTFVLPILIGTDQEIQKILDHYQFLESKIWVKYSSGVAKIVESGFSYAQK